MKKRFIHSQVALALLAALAGLHAAERSASQWASPGPDGKLIYKTTPAGDRIMDFSHAGYMGGGVAIPGVRVKSTVKPSNGSDDTASIQAAIDEVAALPIENGFRGAVQLAPGTFACSNTISINASGVILRGSGADAATGTTIKMTGRPHLAIAVRGTATRTRRQRADDSPRGSETSGTGRQDFKPAETTVTDEYVPSGVTKFTVADASGFKVGDTIEIRRPVTASWIKFMQMDDLVRDGRPQTWLAAGSTITTERQIARMSGKVIAVDVPLADSLDSKYLNPPGATVAKVQPPPRLSNIGIEHLHIESPPQEISHSQSHFSAIRLNGRDCWIRDVVCDETMNSIGINGSRITLQRVAVNRKARHQGSSKPAEFAPNASQLLLDRCSGIGDNVWYAATGGRQPGPVVMLNCTFEGNGRVESHQRWSTAMLYDNCRVSGGGIDFRNRGSMGSGHGWSMGWGAAWNCEAREFVIQNPPGAANWMIGCIGESKLMPRPFGSAPNLAEGIKDSHGTPVTPRSLYLAQLAERLGPQAVKNIGY